MTSKERIITAMKGGITDHVPVSPDISVMVPDRLTGKPLYDIHLDGREHNGWTSATHSDAYIDAVKYYGLDGFYMYGGLKEIKPDGSPSFKSEVSDHPMGKIVSRICSTELGDLTEKEIYFAKEPPWRDEKPIKDLHNDFEKYRLMNGKSDWKWDTKYHDMDRIGDLGIYMGMVPVFQDWWFHNRQGGFEQCFLDFMYEDTFMDMVHEYWLDWSLKYLEAMLEAKADVIMLGGSSASLSISSPEFFRKYELPFIQKASVLCKKAGIPSHLHICGKSWELAVIAANESELDSMEPLEEHPGGDVDMAKAKKELGGKICLKGNINTTSTMIFSSPQEIEDKCKKLIDDAGAEGGFILSTGDQCGWNTPDENLFKIVEVAKTYGKY